MFNVTIIKFYKNQLRNFDNVMCIWTDTYYSFAFTFLHDENPT